MDITNIDGSISLGQLGGARRAEPVRVDLPIKISVPEPQPEPVQVQAPDPSAAKIAESARLERIQASAQAVRNLFAVSDTKFTIFKDASGHFVTRFTSLRDGSVKYFPEQSMYDMARARLAAAPQYNSEV